VTAIIAESIREGQKAFAAGELKNKKAAEKQEKSKEIAAGKTDLTNSAKEVPATPIPSEN
jgi:hypothetical protein